MGFVHLHLHTEHSLLDGSIRVADLFKRVKELGMDAVAITDHGNMQALITKYRLAKEAGVKLIFGVEAYVVDDLHEKVRGERRHHLVLLAKDITGYNNLIKLVSIAGSEGFYYRPRIDKKVLRKYSEGVICTSACIGNDVARAVINGDEAKARLLIEEYIDIFGKENFYLEVERHGVDNEEKVNNFYFRVAPEYGLKVMASADSHYLLKDDAKAHEIMLCIQTNKPIDDPKHFKFPGSGYYVLSEDEMRAKFSDHPEVLDATVEIASRCNVELELDNVVFPDFETPNGASHKDYLHELCIKALEEKYGSAPNRKEAEDRMEFELSVINKMGFATYFLIVADFIREAKKECQVGPGRGSGAGSIVAYLLGITQLEPLGLGLLFERFLNPDRVSLPDFDVDFGDRDVALDFVKKKYGEDKVALIGTFGTMSAKSVLKDVARAFNIPFSVSNEITKHVNEKTIAKSLSLRDEKTNEPLNPELIEYQHQYPELFKIAQRLEGCVRHKGIHACGVVWGRKPIEEYLPVYRKGGDTVTQVDGREVESAGLVKFDFLGLETLNITKNVLDSIGKDSEWLENVPLDDQEVYAMLQKGDSVGTFQMESAGMQKTLRLVKPTCFEDIIAILSLYRPGSMDFIDVYAARKDGTEKFDYVHPNAIPILKPTYGILVYQEQVMQLSRVLANFTMGESDVLRKAIGKKKLDLMMQMEQKFKQGCIEFSGMDEKVVNDLWDNIVKFASYSFNKSHAAAYALIAYRTAYLKKYYPVEFMNAVISANTRNPEKMSFYLEATKSMGIEIVPPEINFSQKTFTVETVAKKKSIIFGFDGIKNVGEEAISEIMRHRPYSSYQDFVNKVDLSKINKRVIKNLISVGCFVNLQYNRAQLLSVYPQIEKEGSSNSKQMTLFGTVAASVVYPDLPELHLSTILEMESELLGVYVSGHPLDIYRLPSHQTTFVFDRFRPDTDVEVYGLVKKFNEITTRTGDRMAFMTVANKVSECEVVIFPNQFREYFDRKSVDEDTCIIIEGTYKENRDRGNNVIANHVKFPPKVL